MINIAGSTPNGSLNEYEEDRIEIWYWLRFALSQEEEEETAFVFWDYYVSIYDPTVAY
jgi:hypothetical protein